MEYSTEELPSSCIDAATGPGNFMTRNARYRKAVCEHFQLRWRSVGGTGNCFFESVCLLLRRVRICPDDLNAHQLRLNVISFFRECSGSTQPLCERVMVEMETELFDPLVCSTHAKLNGVRVNGMLAHSPSHATYFILTQYAGLVPSCVQQYLDACSCDGVWVQGMHWLRAISFLYDVRVGVVIFSQEIVRLFGNGQQTIYLYKVQLVASRFVILS
jgi:hypothetical protein